VTRASHSIIISGQVVAASWKVFSVLSGRHFAPHLCAQNWIDLEKKGFAGSLVAGAAENAIEMVIVEQMIFAYNSVIEKVPR
jgi:hypothetical protein